MTIELAVTVLTTLVGLGVTVLLSSIPWAYGIHGRLTKIETSLHDCLESFQRLGIIERRLTRLEFHNECLWDEEQ